MFIKVPTESRDGVIAEETLSVKHIVRTKEVNGKTVIAQEGMEYNVWSTLSKADVDDMLLQAGATIVEAR